MFNLRDTDVDICIMVVLLKRDMASTNSGTGTAYPSGAPEFTPGF
jgi:hypothetical protein